MSRSPGTKNLKKITHIWHGYSWVVADHAPGDLGADCKSGA